MMPKLLHCAILITCLTLAPQFCFAAEFKKDPLRQATGFPGIGDRTAWNRAVQSYNEGNKHLRADDLESAARSYKKAISVYPYDADFYTNLATVMWMSNDVSAQPEQIIRKAIKLRPNRINQELLLVDILISRKQVTQARKLFADVSAKKLTPAEQEYLVRSRELIKKNYGLNF